MPDEAPLSKKDMQAIQQKLNGNSLLAALLMTSPADAFRYLGFDFKPTDFDDLRPPTREDADLARMLVKSLQEGRSTLAEPYIVQPASDPDLLKPPKPKKKSSRPADITLSVSKATLQHALKLYTEANFRGQEFTFPTQDWWDVTAKGQEITLDLTQEQANVLAKLQGKVSFSLWLLGFKLYEWKTEFPIEIVVQAAFSVDDNNWLYLSISRGKIGIANAPFPASLTSDLIERITNIVPYIPLTQVPTRFQLPDTRSYTTDETAVQLSDISIDDNAVKLEFQLEYSPSS